MKKKKVLIINNEPKRDSFGGIPEINKALAEASPAPVRTEVIFFKDIHLEDIKSSDISHIILSGRNSTYWDPAELPLFADELELIREARRPLLGICAGHQMIGLAYGAQWVPIDDGVVEEGFHAVKLHDKDPLFSGLPGSFNVYQYHKYHIPVLPQEIKILASNDLCPVQAMRCRQRPVYGVQFHPEKNVGNNFFGLTILRNFLNL